MENPEKRGPKDWGGTIPIACKVTREMKEEIKKAVKEDPYILNISGYIRSVLKEDLEKRKKKRLIERQINEADI